MEHELSAWLLTNPGGMVTVPAGEHRDVGGVRFACPAGGAACAVMVTLEDGTVAATSTDGMATAMVVPPPPASGGGGGGGSPPPAVQPPPAPPAASRGGGRLDLSGWLHGLNGLGIQDFNSRVFTIQDGESKTLGRTRFSCRGPGCWVQIHRTGYNYDVLYEGNVTASFQEEPEKIWPGIGRGWNFAGEYHHDGICDLRLADGCHPAELFPGSFKDGDLNFQRSTPPSPGFQNYILVEDKNAGIPASHGFTGRRYAWSPESHGTDSSRHYIIQPGRDSTMLEAVIYTNADPVTDASYLSYGRWLYIDASGDWVMDAVMPLPLWHDRGGPTEGLGTAARGQATYSGGATGFYAVDGGADAGHFTARATLNMNFDNLGISGAIDRFVDENGRSRNWMVDLQPSSFPGRGRFDNEITNRQRTVWTIDGTAGAAARDWRAKAWDNGRWIQGVFDAAHGTDARMVGSYLAEKQ